MAKKRHPPPDWPEKPPGTDADLDAAVALLALPSETIAESQAAPGRLCPWRLYSADEARSWIVEVAQALLSDRAAEATAPRLKTVINRLHAVEDLSGQLHRALSDLDDFSISALHQAAPERTDLSVMFDVGLRGFDREPPNSLETLSRMANRAAGRLAEDFGTGDADAPDAGGATNLFNATYGRAKYQFVRNCGNIYAAAHEDVHAAVRGYENGKLYEFVGIVWWFATGWAAEGNGLPDLVKRVAPLIRQFHDMLNREMQIRSAICILRVHGLDTSEYESDHRRLLDRLDSIAFGSGRPSKAAPSG